MSSFTLPDFSDKKSLEKYSSAFTMSDMEIFIFPELFYPLILANICSPVIWKWRDDPWFDDIEKKSFTYKVNRIKQYIIQNYIFNLDLSTWGLTTKQNEIARFRDFFDPELLRQSNALFGYEGDKYYFDIDIRKHFGLDKFNTDVIPYWKTETVEAMTAFRFKENFTTGGGECVSLSALYAAAMFIVGRIPLEKIFLIATPLHSQNFIVEKEGLLTNNRRIVTKNMWFNGTSLSEKARRALENEKITIVSHISGHIHTIYKEATIDKGSYEIFTHRLKEFLKTELTKSVFINFLRFKSKYKSLFQFECECSGIKRYITLEKLFEYEHSSRYHVTPESRAGLLAEIECEEFHLSPLSGKIFLNEFETILDKHHKDGIDEIKRIFADTFGNTSETDEMFDEIRSFISVEPRLPDEGKKFIGKGWPTITTGMSREEIIQTIIESAGYHETSLLALYAYREMNKIDWIPFVKAAIERNPVSFEHLEGKSIGSASEILNSMPDESIYDAGRLALPDEVWNFRRGDGIEKALLLAGLIHFRDKNAEIEIIIKGAGVRLNYNGSVYSFNSSKSFGKTIRIRPGEYHVS